MHMLKQFMMRTDFYNYCQNYIVIYFTKSALQKYCITLVNNINYFNNKKRTLIYKIICTTQEKNTFEYL